MIGLALSSILASAPPVLPDDTPTIGLRWDAPEGCADADAVTKRLRSLLPELPVGDEGTIAVRVELTAVAAGWSVRVEVDGELGVERREFVAERCDVAMDASALVVAVALDPISVAREFESLGAREAESEAEPEGTDTPEREAEGSSEAQVELEPTSRTATEPEPVPELPLVDEPAERRRDRARPRIGLALLGGGGFGPLAAGSASVSMRVAVFGLHWRWELHGAYLPPITHAVAGDRRIRADGWALGTRGCGVLSRRALEFPLCAGIEAGAVRGTPLGSIANARSGSHPWVAAELGPGLSFSPHPRLAIGLELAALLPFVAGGFALDEQPVLSYSPVGVRALAGVEVRLP